LHRISRSFAGVEVFSGVSLQIKSGEKIALVGRNGVGKTTLFRILLGELTPDQGEVSRTKGIKIGYLPQEVQLDRSWTLMDEVLDAFSELLDMKERIAKLVDRIASGDADKAAMSEYGHLQERFEREGGFTYQARTDEVLQGLGFLQEEYSKPLSLFSGGEKSRAYISPNCSCSNLKFSSSTSRPIISISHRRCGSNPT
jgi:ATP-binding cassette subfamily F protein 3